MGSNFRFFCVLIVLMSTGCWGQASDFSYSTPESEGVSSRKLQQLLERVEQTDSSSLLILKNKKIIFEKYYPSEGLRAIEETPSPAKLFNCYSITKSVASLLIGQLIREGKIKSVDAPLSTWFPSWSTDVQKSQITLRMVLNHTTGLHEPENFFLEEDSLEFLKNLPVDFKPGTHFHYSTAITTLLSEIIRQASGGIRVDDYAQDVLFDPLEIKRSEIRWTQDRSGTIMTGFGIEMKPLDLLKMGWVLADNGVWKQQQVVDPLWIAQLRQPSRKDKLDLSLLWWLFPARSEQPSPVYSAAGMGGQYVIIIPEQQMVVVRTRQLPKGEDKERFLSNNFIDLIELSTQLGI